MRLLVLLTFCFGLAQAQRLHFGVVLGSLFTLEPLVRLENLELRDTKIDLRLAVHEGLEFGVTMRQTTSFGPLGNVGLEGQADVSTRGDYQARLQAEGVIGTVAAKLGGQFFNTPPNFAIGDVWSDIRPRFANAGASLDVGLSYRLSRTLVISANPSLYFMPEGLGLRLNADVKAYKLFDPNDGTFLLLAYVAPGAEASYGALGFQFDLNEKNLPSVAGSVWLSVGSDGILPGIRASFTQTLKDLDAKYGAELGLEPYRTDFIPYRLRGFYQQAFDVGTLEANLYLTLGQEDLAPVRLELGYTYKF